jgi:hypothetical protein
MNEFELEINPRKYVCAECREEIWGRKVKREEFDLAAPGCCVVSYYHSICWERLKARREAWTRKSVRIILGKEKP